MTETTNKKLFVQLEINCWLLDYELMTKHYVTIGVMREWLIVTAQLNLNWSWSLTW